MATLVVKDLSVFDIPDGPRLCEADRRECEAIGMSEREALVKSVMLSNECWVLEVDGRPAVYGGYSIPSLLSPTAHVWMLGTDEAKAHAVAVARIGRRGVEMLLQRFEAIFVVVHKQHKAGARWAKWLGFSVYSHYGNLNEYRALRRKGH